MVVTILLQWNLHIPDTIGNKSTVLNKEVVLVTGVNLYKVQFGIFLSVFKTEVSLFQ